MTPPSPSPTPSEHPETPQASAADLLLIERLPSVLAAALPDEDSGQGSNRRQTEAPADGSSEASSASDAAVHAEALHQLCLADGLLELLDWTHQGVGADPLACFWLAALRWHRLVTGGFPEAAPRPPSRSVDEQLSARLRAAGRTSGPQQDGAVPLAVRPGTETPGVDGLAAGEMAYPTAPAQPELDDPTVLLRLVPLALVPYIDDALREQWVRQATALTHGHPLILDRAQRLVHLFRRAASAPAAELAEHADSLGGELDELLAGAEGEAPVSSTPRRRCAASCRRCSTWRSRRSPTTATSPPR
ncbi:ADP-ribosylglycohydrolase [Nesterenkonia sp. F]|uniref:ADP-ribosylglycohydrolase n=1 Tax=Nesterenkonia sp. F TaxID=795955 RepID=UPI000255D9A9|nr:ADP-ribosylglycohydrolase [Nesterenkonia sp. F]